MIDVRHTWHRSTAWISVVALLVLVLAGQLAAQALPQASGSAAFAHVTALSQTIGPRSAGSPADAAGAEYIANQLRNLGYSVEQQAFPFRYFEEVQPPSLTVVSPTSAPLTPLTMEYAASTPERGVEGELAPAGLGREEDVRGKSLEGKIALVERGQIFFSAKVANAADAGAVAVIIYNNQPGPPQSGTLREPARLPAVIISQEEGQSLLRMLVAGSVRVRLVVRTLTGQRTSHNVIGIKRGTRTPGEIVVIGGHRDSVHVSPGANDNASGIAAMLEAARLLAQASTSRTVHFVGFGAEELGLIGSRFYAQNHPGTVVGMVNMDMVGRGKLMIGNSSDDARLVDLAETVAARLGIRVGRFQLRGDAGSDHFSFERIGVPAVFIHTGDDPAIHTPNDIAARVDPVLLAQAATLAAHIALELAR